MSDRGAFTRNQPSGHPFTDTDGDGLCDFVSDFPAAEARCLSIESEHNVAPAPADVGQLRVVCSYCQKVLHEGAPGASTSHGICTSQACREKFKGTSSGLVEVNERGELEHLA